MIYKCSECRHDIGLLGTRDGRIIDKDGNPVRFFCPNAQRVATLVAPR